MTAPLHRMPERRLPLIAAFVSGAAAIAMASLALTLVSAGY